MLATHRVLAGLGGFPAEAFRQRVEQWFDTEAFSSSGELREALDSAPAGRSAIGVSLQGAARNYLLRGRPDALETCLPDVAPEERSLDVVVLHRLLLAEALGISAEDVRELKNISYVRGFDAAVAEVRSGQAQIAFLLRPGRCAEGRADVLRGWGDASEVHGLLSEALVGSYGLPNRVSTTQVSAAAESTTPNVASACRFRWKICFSSTALSES